MLNFIAKINCKIINYCIGPLKGEYFLLVKSQSTKSLHANPYKSCVLKTENEIEIYTSNNGIA